MNLEDIKTLRDLHQLITAGIITADDFSQKKNEIFNSQKTVSSDEKIKLLQELHQLLQEGIISQSEFDGIKQRLLSSSTTVPTPVAPVQNQYSGSSQNSGSQQNSFSGSATFSGSGVETTLHEMDVDGLKMKLTNEKLYVNSATSNETFALRSVNGVGIVDLVDRYNSELSAYKTAMEEFKKKKNAPLGCLIPGIAFGLVFLFGPEGDSTGIAIAFFLISMSIVVYYFWNKQTPKEPTEPVLMSAVRIMLSSMNRDFEFDKKSSKAQEVAKFVALVEDTLTAYHKNN